MSGPTDMACKMCGCTYADSCCDLMLGVCEETESGICSICLAGKTAPKLSEWRNTHMAREAKNRHRHFSEHELSFIRENYSVLSRREVAWVLGRTVSAIKSIIDKRIGVRKTKEQIREVSAKSTNSGRFKKGNIALNSLGSPGIVTVRERVDRQQPATQFIKMDNGKWLHLHRYIWELKHGPVPKGHVIAFKDGNAMHCTLDNLEMITMKKNMERNSGQLNLPDTYIASQLAKEGRQVRQDIRDELLEHPELLDVKRHQIILNRKMKENGKADTKKPAGPDEK